MSDNLPVRIIKNRWSFWFVVFCAALPGLSSAYYALLVLQQNAIPVASEFEVDELIVDEFGDVVISGSFVKNFPGWACKYRSQSFYSKATGVSGDPILLRVHHEHGDERPHEDDNNRPKGYTRFWDWKVYMSEYPDQRSFYPLVRHTCLGFWPARTKLPTIQLPKRELIIEDGPEVIIP